jgi:hypothetical protein
MIIRSLNDQLIDVTGATIRRAASARVIVATFLESEPTLASFGTREDGNEFATGLLNAIWGAFVEERKVFNVIAWIEDHTGENGEYDADGRAFRQRMQSIEEDV